MLATTRIITTWSDSEGKSSPPPPAGAVPYGEPYSSTYQHQRYSNMYEYLRGSSYRVNYQDYEVPDDTPANEGSTLAGYTALVD